MGRLMNVELEALGLIHSCYLLAVYVILGKLFYLSEPQVVSL